MNLLCLKQFLKNPTMSGTESDTSEKIVWRDEFIKAHFYEPEYSEEEFSKVLRGRDFNR